MNSDRVGRIPYILGRRLYLSIYTALVKRNHSVTMVETSKKLAISIFKHQNFISWPRLNSNQEKSLF